MRVPVLPPDLVVPLVGYLVVANLLALAMFATRRAGSSDGEWGGNETRTLFLAVMGGWPGAMLGRMLFRPKHEIRAYGFLLKASVLVLPVVVALPILMRALPGWIPKADAKGPTPIADSSIVRSAAGKLGGSPASTDVASTLPPPRPANLTGAGSAGSPATGTVPPPDSTSGSAASAP